MLTFKVHFLKFLSFGGLALVLFYNEGPCHHVIIPKIMYLSGV